MRRVARPPRRKLHPDLQKTEVGSLLERSRGTGKSGLMRDGRAMNPRYSKRKQVYVNGMIQGRLMARLAVYWGIYHVVLWHAMFFYRYMVYRDAVVNGAPQVPVPQLYAEFVSQNYTVIVCALAVFPVVLWDMLSQSHRIAGPLVRFQMVLRQLAAGQKVERVTLRRDDLLVEFQNTFNEFLEQIDYQIPRARPAGSAPRVPDDHGHLLDDLQEIQQTVELAGLSARLNNAAASADGNHSSPDDARAP